MKSLYWRKKILLVLLPVQRNSGVIHAGVYYDKDSMKAKFCADGNRRMYEYCQKFNVPHINTGKFIVATSSNEIPKL